MPPSQILRILDICFILGSIAALVSLPVFLVNWLIYMKRIRKDRSLLPDYLKAPFPAKSVLAFAISVLGTMAIAEMSKSIAHNSIAPLLAHMNDSFEIQIDGIPVSNKQGIISALQSLSCIPAHHSHPTTTMSLVATNTDTQIKLVLARDSSNSQEYWVFMPDYYITSKNEIGRIVSPAFATY